MPSRRAAVVLVVALFSAGCGAPAESSHPAANRLIAPPMPSHQLVAAAPIATAPVMHCAGDLQMGLVTTRPADSAAAAAAKFRILTRGAQPQSRLFGSLVSSFLALAHRDRTAALADRRFRSPALIVSCTNALRNPS